MPVLTKFEGIVIRMLIDRTFGMRLHAFYGDTEMVMGLNPLRVIQSDVSPWVREQALAWARNHQDALKPVLAIDPSLAKPLSRQYMRCSAAFK